MVDSSGEEAPVVDVEGRTVGAISVERMVHALAGDTANGEDGVAAEAGADAGSGADTAQDEAAQAPGAPPGDKRDE